MKVKYYLRYCDDFIILSNCEDDLRELIIKIQDFLSLELKLTLHKDKVNIRKLSGGVDFLGYIVLPYHTILRTKTKKRMFKRVNKKNKSSYLGLLSHCDGYRLGQQIKKQISVSNS